MARSAFIVPKKRERWAGHIEVHMALRRLASRQARPSSHREPSPPEVRLPSSSQTGPHASGSGVSRGS